jgi:hypothetical protein
VPTWCRGNILAAIETTRVKLLIWALRRHHPSWHQQLFRKIGITSHPARLPKRLE